MTEAEWLTCADPEPMLSFVRGEVSDRKLRLFGVACCRRIWHLLSDQRSRSAVEVAERYADGWVSPAELTAAWRDANDAYEDGSDAFYRMRTDIERPHSVAPHGAAIHVVATADWSLIDTAKSAAYSVFNNISPYTEADVDAAVIPEKAAQAPLLRCIVGNPYRTVAADPSWLTSAVTGLARAIYADRAFDRLPILADALQDAGCDDEQPLAHCRSDGPHVRGCWAVDLVLCKT